MQGKILSYIFLDLYNNSGKGRMSIEENPNLEETLENYLISILGYGIKHNYIDNLKEIRVYFENIIENRDYSLNLIDSIKAYTENYKNMIESHKYVNYFIEAMKTIYDRNYNGRISVEDKYTMKDSILAVQQRGKTLTIGTMNKKDEFSLPSIHIYDIDIFEKILKKYIESVVKSNSFYNLFDNINFNTVSFDDKIKILLQCTMFNAIPTDVNCIENFFMMYTDFINDETFDKVKSPKLIGNLFNDELYVMSKRSELEYETPYYLAFMLKNNKVELPDIRMGIQNKDGKKTAHIIATQTAQTILNIENLKIIQDEIKSNLPSDPYFRFYNPTHLISILLTFGILNGMGIKKVNVKDFLPYRYNKTVLDKQLSESEADDYQTRLTNKNLMTYMRLIELVDGIDVVSYPDMGEGLILSLQDKVICKNDFLQKIYDEAYKFGQENKIEYNKVKEINYNK